MITLNSYVPIVKGREGEYKALKELTNEQRDCITPLVEIPIIPWDYSDDMPAKTIDQHLEKVAAKLEDCWGADPAIFIDLSLLQDEEQMRDGRHPLSYILDSCREKGVQAIPVAGIGYDRNYQDAVMEAVSEDGRGFCFRLTNSDFEEYYSGIEREIENLLSRFQLPPEEVDLLIDLGEITPAQAGPISVAVSGILNAVPRIEEWRSMILSATAFPRDLRGFEANTISTTPRTEWITWNLLAENSENIPRMPTFSDYAIAHPEPTEIDPRYMRMSANLRYTADQQWIILKGRNVKDYGFEQMKTLCLNLRQRAEYSGKEFSWGDDYIWKCAEGEVGPGNATTWRKLGTSHHFAFVVEQIANSPVS